MCLLKHYILNWITAELVKENQKKKTVEKIRWFGLKSDIFNWLNCRTLLLFLLE